MINKKISFLELIMYILFFILSIFIIKVMYFDNKYYKDKLYKLTNIYVYLESSPRGRIYDRNYNLLVDNKEIFNIVYKKENISKEKELELIYEVINHIDLNYNKLNIRNLKEFYLVKYSNLTNNLITKDEMSKYKKRVLSSNDIYNLKISRIKNSDLEIFTEEDKKAAYLYYLMNNDYSYKEKIIKEDATYLEYAYFNENKYLGFSTKISWDRVYLYGNTLKSILGSIGKVPKEEKDKYLDNNYSLDEKIGISNIEKQYEEILRGQRSKYKKISNNNLELISDSKKGNDIVLTIDINLQQQIDTIIDNNLIKAKNEANTTYLNKTYVIIQEPNTGEVLAISGRGLYKEDNSYKTYDITPYALTDPMVPGSVIKGASMLVGYNTDSIKINEYLTDECIKLYSFPRKCSSHRVGYLNDIKALAESSNVYQFKIALKVAGINYSYNDKVDIDRKYFDIYRNAFKELGLGIKTGIDLPVESIGYIGSKVSPDLYLNLSIGQYDTYTPIQLSQYITTIASNGNRLKPRLLKEVYKNFDTKELLRKEEPVVLNKVSTKDEYLKRIQEGFISVMKDGLGRNVMGNILNPAGKTGTSESFIDTNNDKVVDTKTVSNAFVGYAPYDNPKMTITVTTPDVEDPNTGISYHSYVNRKIAREISNLFSY